MKKAILSLGILAAILMLSACSSSNDANPSFGSVYVMGGKTDNNAAWWTSGSTLLAAYWHSGNFVYLPGTEGAHAVGAAVSMAADGSDIYVVGKLNSAGNHIVYWRNGAYNVLDNSLNASASDIAIHNHDMYICGVQPVNEISTASFWKNGVVTNLPMPEGMGVIKESAAYRVGFAGDDLYIAGTVNTGFSAAVVVWKNGQVIFSNKDSDGTQFRDAKLKDGVMYVMFFSGNQIQVWNSKNATALTLPSPAAGFNDPWEFAVVNNDFIFMSLINKSNSFLNTNIGTFDSHYNLSWSNSKVSYDEALDANGSDVFAAGFEVDTLNRSAYRRFLLYRNGDALAPFNGADSTFVMYAIRAN